MTTFVYMVRHGESPKEPGGDERTRGLTARGEADAPQNHGETTSGRNRCLLF